MKIYTTGQAAKIAHCSQQTIIRLCNNNMLQHHRIPGSKFRRIKEADLYNLMQNHHIPIDNTPETTPNHQIKEAFKPFKEALEKNETDTIGKLTKDDCILFTLAGTWTGTSNITLGNLRQLAKAIEQLP